MSVSDGLLQRARDQLIPEPIVFTVDKAGNHHFAADQLPWRAVIDVRGGVMFPGVEVDPEAGTVTITADGRTVTYERRGYELHGAWVCNLVSQ